MVNLTLIVPVGVNVKVVNEETMPYRMKILICEDGVEIINNHQHVFLGMEKWYEHKENGLSCGKIWSDSKEMVRAKACSRCEVYKPVEEFSPISNRPHEYRSECKNCRTQLNKERPPKPENLKALYERRKTRYASDSEYRKRIIDQTNASRARRLARTQGEYK